MELGKSKKYLICKVIILLFLNRFESESAYDKSSNKKGSVDQRKLSSIH